MKKILSIVVLLAGVMLITSCSSEDATYTPVKPLEILTTDLSFEPDGGSGTITVNTSSAVTATTESSWLTLSVNGNVVTATAPLNSSLDGRSALITITDGKSETEVTATQKGSVYGIAGGLEYTIADSLGANVSIPVVHTSPVTVSSEADWFTVTFNAETSAIEIVAKANPDATERTATVAFQTGIIKDELSITQVGLTLNLDAKVFNISNAGGKLEVGVEYSQEFTVTTDADWVTTEFDVDRDTLVMTVGANPTIAPREAVVSVTSGNVTKSVTITQFDPISIYGDYMFLYKDDKGELKYFAATLTETELQIPALNWSIPVTTDNEAMSVTIDSGSYVGTFQAYFMYMLFMDTTAQYWTGSSTTAKATATLSLVDYGGVPTLAGDFVGTFGSNREIGSFLFSAFGEQKLDVSDSGSYVGDLLECYEPSLLMIPATEEAAPMLNRAMKETSVPTLLRRPKHMN